MLEMPEINSLVVLSHYDKATVCQVREHKGALVSISDEENPDQPIILIGYAALKHPTETQLARYYTAKAESWRKNNEQPT